MNETCGVTHYTTAKWHNAQAKVELRSAALYVKPYSMHFCRLHCTDSGVAGADFGGGGGGGGGGLSYQHI